MKNLERFFVPPDGTLRQAMQVINATAKGTALIVDETRVLRGILTDGDVRRALLAGAGLDAPVRDWMVRQPITIGSAAHSHEISALMALHQIRQLPILDEAGRAVDLRLADEPALAAALPVQAVIMAGGMGERLRPLTDAVPKPLLHVGTRPILEILVGLLREWGIRNIWLAVNYRADLIEGYFQDGAQWDVSIRYLREPKPLGTIGAVGMIAGELQQTTLVINGDILTQLDLRKMYRFHCESRAAMTVGVRHYDFQVPFGVIHIEEGRVRSLAEKPIFEFSVNAGIYLLEPQAAQRIPPDTRFDAPDLIAALLQERQLVNAYPIHEYWLDIGQLPDYEQANRDMRTLGPEQGDE